MACFARTCATPTTIQPLHNHFPLVRFPLVRPKARYTSRRRAARWLAGLSSGSRLATALAHQTNNLTQSAVPRRLSLVAYARLSYACDLPPTSPATIGSARLYPPPRPLSLRPLPNQNSAYPPNEMSSHMRALCGVQIHRVLFWLGAAEGAGEMGGAAEARLCRDFFKGAALATK